MAEARKKVLDAMSYNLGHGYRLQHPGFRGLPDNSTGSKNRPFFAAKDEADVPLESKVQARGGGNPGALWNPAGRKYAKQILQRRAVDSSALEEGLEAPQVVPPAGSEPPSSEKKFELTQLLKQLAVTVTQGNFNELTFGVMRQSLSLLFGIMPFMDDDELVDARAKFDFLENIATQQLSEKQPGRSAGADAILSLMGDTFDSVTQLIKEYIVRTKTTRTLDEKRTIIKELIKKYVDKDIVKALKQVRPDIAIATDRSEEFMDEPGGDDAVDAMLSLVEYFKDPEENDDNIRSAVEDINRALELDIDVTDDQGNLISPVKIKQLIGAAIREALGYNITWKKDTIIIK